MAKARAIIQNLAVRPERAAAMLDISTSYLWELVKSGKIRPPYRISPRVLLFDVGRLIEDWDAMKADVDASAASNSWDEVLEA